MMTIRSVLLLALLGFLVSGCASGEKFVGLESPDKNQARVYLYRPFNLMQSGVFPDVLVDSKEVGTLKNGGYLTFTVPEGLHKITLAGGFLQWGHSDRDFALEAADGETCFYQLDTTTSQQGTYTLVGYAFFKAEKDVAMTELVKLKASDSTKIK